MAAATITMYDCFSEAIGDGTIDMDNDTFKVALILSGYSPAQSDTTFSVIDANEHANANGYTTGGEALASVTWAQTAGTAKFDAADTVWTAAGGSIVARYAVVYSSTVGGANDLVCWVLMDSAPADITVTTGNTLTLQWNASGIFTLAN